MYRATKRQDDAYQKYQVSTHSTALNNPRPYTRRRISTESELSVEFSRRKCTAAEVWEAWRRLSNRVECSPIRCPCFGTIEQSDQPSEVM